MKAIKLVSLGAAAVLVLSVAGCAAAKQPPSSGSGPKAQSPIELVAVKNTKPKPPDYGVKDNNSILASKGANEFALRLSAQLLAEKPGENFVSSPYSVWLPLAALLNAADEAHRPALLEALGVGNITAKDVNTAAAHMLYELTREQEQEKETYHNPLKIANAIFVDNKVTLKEEFAQTFWDSYRGQAMLVDFREPSAVDAVNQWASDNTEGLIDSIVQEFSPDTVAAIANAIYFSDRWFEEFNPDQTQEDVFHAPVGEKKAQYMLREGDGQLYYEDDKLQAMPLRFKTGGGLLILLPKNGAPEELLSGMDQDYYTQIFDKAEARTGKLLLPRFRIDSGLINLKDALIALGVPLFDPDSAPLSELIEEKIPVWLENAVQKAVIEVDEKGTTAAAVTVMEARTTSMPIPTEPFEMVCDKPFAFILYGRSYNDTSHILFTGVVNQPE